MKGGKRWVARLVHRPITMESWHPEGLIRFRDGDVVHQVKEVLDRWREMGDWWNGEGERYVLRVLTEDQGLYDIERIEEDWFLYRIWD